MAARFRIQVNADGYRRFQELAAIWPAITAANQTNLVLGAKTKAEPGFLHSNEFGRFIRYDDESKKGADRLRAVSRYWPKMNRESQAAILEHAYQVADLRGQIPLAAIAEQVERLQVGTYNTARLRTAHGDDARRFASEHGTRLGEYRGEFGCWFANHVKGEGRIVAYGREIARRAAAGNDSGSDAAAELDDAAVAL